MTELPIWTTWRDVPVWLKANKGRRANKKTARLNRKHWKKVNARGEAV